MKNGEEKFLKIYIYKKQYTVVTIELNDENCEIIEFSLFGF